MLPEKQILRKSTSGKLERFVQTYYTKSPDAVKANRSSKFSKLSNIVTNEEASNLPSKMNHFSRRIRGSTDSKISQQNTSVRIKENIKQNKIRNKFKSIDYS